MKRVLLAVFVLAVAGCSGQKVQSYLENPATLLEDPLSVNHQRALDELESSYLRKEITYADYLQKKKLLEDDYTKAANARRSIIENEP